MSPPPRLFHSFSSSFTMSEERLAFFAQLISKHHERHHMRHFGVFFFNESIFHVRLINPGLSRKRGKKRKSNFLSGNNKHLVDIGQAEDKKTSPFLIGTQQDLLISECCDQFYGFFPLGQIFVPISSGMLNSSEQQLEKRYRLQCSFHCEINQILSASRVTKDTVGMKSHHDR